MDLAPTTIEPARTKGRGVHLDAELVRYLRSERMLEVAFRPRLDVQLRLGSWDDGLPLFRFEDGKWCEDPTDPPLFYFGRVSRLDPGHPVAELCGGIPTPALAIASGCSSWHLTVLRLLRESQAAAELGCSSPNLLWLVAASVDRRSIRPRDAKALFARRRVDLLSWCLGTTSRPAAVRFVDKYTPVHRAREELGLLERAVAVPGLVHSLGHLPIAYPEDLDRLLRNLEPFLRNRPRDCSESTCPSSARSASRC